MKTITLEKFIKKLLSCNVKYRKSKNLLFFEGEKFNTKENK